MKTEVAIGVISVGIAALALAHQVYAGRAHNPEIVGRDSRFYCALQADTSRGGEVWTVMYERGAKISKPWLRMVRTMGNDWDTKARCQEIAQRLDTYRQDGLLGFEYRQDVDTPEQYVICAKTQLSGDNCPLVVTLAPADDPYQALHEVAGALLPGRLPSYQCNNDKTCPVAEPVDIRLGSQLEEEDL